VSLSSVGVLSANSIGAMSLGATGAFSLVGKDTVSLSSVGVLSANSIGAMTLGATGAFSLVGKDTVSLSGNSFSAQSVGAMDLGATGAFTLIGKDTVSLSGNSFSAQSVGAMDLGATGAFTLIGQDDVSVSAVGDFEALSIGAMDLGATGALAIRGYSTLALNAAGAFTAQGNSMTLGATGNLNVNAAGVTVTAQTIALGTTGSTVSILGNMQVSGTLSYVHSEQLLVTDKQLYLHDLAGATDAQADTGGIVLRGATDHSWTWSNDRDAWQTNDSHLNVPTGKTYRIDDKVALSASQLALNTSATDGGLYLNGSSSISAPAADQWRMRVSGVNLVFEKYVDNAWVIKQQLV